MAIWQQVVSIASVTNGYFDNVAVAKIKDAQAATLSKIWKEHKKDMEMLETGAKPTEEILKTIETVAKATAKGFEA